MKKIEGDYKLFEVENGEVSERKESYERNNAEQIGDVLRQFLRQQGLETPLNEYRLVDAWKDVVGPVITRYTTNLLLKTRYFMSAFLLP